jgi:hypothetical protein
MDISSPDGWSVQGHHPLTGKSLGQPVGIALRRDEVGVVQQPVDRRGGYLDLIVKCGV